MVLKRMDVPLGERGGKLRFFVDLVTGCYPKFLFGGGVEDILPVFHFHEVSPEFLEPLLLYLHENGYHTVSSEVLFHFVKTGKHPGSRTVALCFDDAWASLWTVAAPLLRKYGLSAITYAIPSKIVEANELRPTMDEGVKDPAAVDRSDTPFATWIELQNLQETGIIDVQSHTYSHSKIFCSNRVVDFVTPTNLNKSLLSRPLVSAKENLSYLNPSDLGAPIYPHRSRMSDALRFFEDETVKRRCMEYVKRKGGTEFFKRSNWKNELLSLVKTAHGDYETSEQRKKSIVEELRRARDLLNRRLGTNTVRQVCFPWGVAGEVAIGAAKKCGYETAISDRWFGMRAVRFGDNPFRLMRLPNRYIFSLPGAARRIFIFPNKYNRR